MLYWLVNYLVGFVENKYMYLKIIKTTFFIPCQDDFFYSLIKIMPVCKLKETERDSIFFSFNSVVKSIGKINL